MAFVGDIKGVVDLAVAGWGWARNRMDPVRAQAQRMIDVFEAYGIARQQIARVLPADIQLSPFLFSNPDRLSEKITPRLLDWVAEYLAINRQWLDGIVGSAPHLRVNGYKNAGVFVNWLSARKNLNLPVDRTLYVWKASKEAVDRVALALSASSTQSIRPD
jgi:hypothetical protein